MGSHSYLVNLDQTQPALQELWCSDYEDMMGYCSRRGGGGWQLQNLHVILPLQNLEAGPYTEEKKWKYPKDESIVPEPECEADFGGYWGLQYCPDQEENAKNNNTYGAPGEYGLYDNKYDYVHNYNLAFNW